MFCEKVLPALTRIVLLLIENSDDTLYDLTRSYTSPQLSPKVSPGTLITVPIGSVADLDGIWGGQSNPPLGVQIIIPLAFMPRGI